MRRESEAATPKQNSKPLMLDTTKAQLTIYKILPGDLFSNRSARADRADRATPKARIVVQP
jgi:hypothetical protein